MPVADTLPVLSTEAIQLQPRSFEAATSDLAPPEHRATPIVREPLSLAVEGVLPQYLTNAALYRIGPGVVDVKHSDDVPYKTTHYFDLPGFLHEYRIDAAQNTVTYRNVCLAESKLRAIESTPSSSFKDITFGKKDPCRSLFGKLSQLFVPFPIDPLTNKTAAPNINVTVEHLPGKGLVALTDGSDIVKVDENQLAADHFFKYDDVIPDARGNFSSSHGHYDTNTEEYINFTYKFGGSRVQYRVFSLPSEGKPRVIASFEETPRYLHSFAVTDGHIIMILWPLQVHPLKILFHQNVMAGLEYKESDPTTFVVISRSENKVVAKYTTDSFFCFHQLNAYDVNDGIVIDISWWPNANILDEAVKEIMYGESVLHDNAPARIVLSGLQGAVGLYPKESSSVTVDILSQRALEAPSVNPLYHRREYRYAYGVTKPAADSENMSEIIKLDVTNSNTVVWGQKNTIVCEPLFVPDPHGIDEDDGCVLTIVSDMYRDTASMVVLDGKDLKEVARATIPMLMPGGFHGKVVHMV